MKKILWIVIVLIFAANSSAFAKPERLLIKTEEAKGRHSQAKALAKTVDLSKVADLEVRKALQAIFKTLNMQAKK